MLPQAEGSKSEGKCGRKDNDKRKSLEGKLNRIQEKKVTEYNLFWQETFEHHILMKLELWKTLTKNV
jgi:hypothetical protein